MLLTRSPLEYPASGAFPFDLHVLSTPPAFVLSQDQTLHKINFRRNQSCEKPKTQPKTNNQHTTTPQGDDGIHNCPSKNHRHPPPHNRAAGNAMITKNCGPHSNPDGEKAHGGRHFPYATMIHACTTTTHTITTTARIIYSGTHCSRYHPAHTHHTPHTRGHAADERHNQSHKQKYIGTLLSSQTTHAHHPPSPSRVKAF